MTEGSNRPFDSDWHYRSQESGTTESTHRTKNKTATINDLPTELFHQFLDLLECTDHETLSSCTLVCRGWLEISQQHLFSELHVLRSCDETFQNLVDWLEQHPAHAGYIRTLSLESRLVSAPPQVSLMPALPLDTLAHLLRILPNLQALRLHQLKIEAPAAAAAALRATPYPSASAAARRYALEHMEYQKCRCELRRTFELLAWFHIDHLDFDPVFVDADVSPPLALPMEPGDSALDVHSLCVSPIAEDPLAAFRALQHFVRPNMIRSFRYPCMPFCATPVPVVQFLRDVGQRIVDLDLCASTDDDYLVLPQLPSLQVFRYHTCVPLLCAPARLAAHRAEFTAFTDSWVPRLPADLERFVLYVPLGQPDAAAPAAPGPLGGLEGALRARVRCLARLTVVFPEPPADLAAASAAAAKCFPVFHERGVLEVTVRRWELECRDWDIYGYLHDDC